MINFILHCTLCNSCANQFDCILGLKGTYTLDSREQSCIQMIKQTVGSLKVLVLVSGGVDSTVLAGLCYKALDHNQVGLVTEFQG